MPNVMVALLNIGGALCSKQQCCQDAKAVEITWSTPNYRLDLSR